MGVADDIAARKREQLQESKARETASQGVDGTEGHEHNAGLVDDGANDGASNDPNPPERRQADDEPDHGARKPIPMSPADEARAAIAKRFRREAPEDVVPFNGDMTDPEMLYGRVAQQQIEPDPDLPEPGVAHEPVRGAEAVAPAKRKLTVRGQTVEMTDDEILAAAQKTLAADSYLDEARVILKDAKEIRAERAGRDPHHPEGQTSTQDDALDNDGTDGTSRHPGNELREVVEKIQYGDPEEAARLLGDAIDKTADKKADERQIKRLMDNDLAKAQVALKTFMDANPALKGDEIADKVIEQNIYKVYREDIEKLGVVDPDKIPTDPKTVAAWHRFYRINGAAVRDMPTILNEAKARLDTWRGTPAAKPQAERRIAARVDVNVDRNERRAAIPNSPTRSASPPARATQQPQQPQGRSSVIMKMKAARGQLTS